MKSKKNRRCDGLAVEIYRNGIVPFFVAILPHCYSVEAIPYAEETFGMWELQRYDYTVIPVVETPLY